MIAGQIVGNELAGPAVFSPPARQGQEPGTARPWLSSARHDLGEGLRWVWQHRAIRDVTIMAAVAGAYGLLLAVGAVGGITC